MHVRVNRVLQATTRPQLRFDLIVIVGKSRPKFVKGVVEGRGGFKNDQGTNWRRYIERIVLLI